MEFKHIAFITTLVCCGWALLISGMITLEKIQTIKGKSELPVEEVAAAAFAPTLESSEFESVTNALNYSIPVAFICVLLLVFCQRSDPIGILPLAGVIALFWFSSSRVMETANLVEQHSEYSIDVRVWWK